MINKKYVLELTFFLIILTGLIAIFIQITHIYLNGYEICLNNGCEFIEKLTYIPSIFFNLIGFSYFLFVFIFKILEKKHPFFSKILNLFLICGASSEGVLLSFQIFVAHHYCSYCIFLLILVFFLIFLRGLEVFSISISILLSEMIIFSLLNFSGAIIKQIDKGLVGGSFAKVITTSPTNNRQIFLIFSNKCPHCKNVLKKLPTNVSIYLNPLSYISKIPGLNPQIKIETFKHYNPEVNLLFIKIIKDKEVPILIITTNNNIHFIEGDNSIINYLKRNLKSIVNPTIKNGITNQNNNQPNEGCLFGTSCSEENSNKVF